MRRVFELDVLECPRCAGRMKILAPVTQPEAIAGILRCLGRPTVAPPIAGSRPPRDTFAWRA